ncbi:MAG: bifunctional folylpolyglutamate synthase/dihydrofolate synthase [bacterium]
MAPPYTLNNTRPTSDDINALLTKLAERRPKIIDLGLERVLAALMRLGAPHTKLPPVIHVAGTNGKGSTIAFMRSILEQAGLRIHSYTSPHLVRFNERIVLAGEPISDQRLAGVLGKCEAAAGDMELTYFEAVTAAAFLAFAETPADILLLETGLGGRLDATNVIESPLASVITPIGLDHQDWLGESITDIAAEKAGIIKKQRPVIIGAQISEAMRLLENRALALGAPLHIAGQDWHIHEEHGRLIFQDDDSLSDLALPQMTGRHQIENAGLAIAALKVAGLAPNNDKISDGIHDAFWPGRLQRLTRGPLVTAAKDKTHEDVEIWLDGGHNPHAGRALARAMADLEEIRARPLILISGMQANKDSTAYYTAFTDMASAVYTVSASKSGAHSAEQLAAYVQQAGLPATISPSVSDALNTALDDCLREGNILPRVLICGSLYLAGEVLVDNG